MIIAIDMIGTNLGSGTKTYNLNFCKQINNEKIQGKIYIFITKEYLNFLDKNNNPNIFYIVKSSIFSNIFLRLFWMQLIFPFQLKKLKVDRLYSPMNIGPIFLKFFNIKFILALHSNLPWVHFSKMPGNRFRNYFTKFFMETSIKACDKLIVDSYFSKKEIVQHLKLNEKKIFVIYLGIDEKFLDKNKNNYNLVNFEYKNYFLSVLSCVRYHNIIKMLQGFKLLKNETNADHKFVLVLQILDKIYFTEINNYISKNFKDGEIVILKNLESKYLVNIYKNASIYIFSSYCEVFGFTSLEAMTQKCPVLISSKSALPEINGNAALYFDPDNEEDIKNSMKKLLCDEKLRLNLIYNGFENYRKYSWSKTVKDTMKVLI